MVMAARHEEKVGMRSLHIPVDKQQFMLKVQIGTRPLNIVGEDCDTEIRPDMFPHAFNGGVIVVFTHYAMGCGGVDVANVISPPYV